jgi:hypothetical protein
MFSSLSDSTFIEAKDSTGKIKFYPKTKKFEAEIKPPDLLLEYPDTVFQTKKIIQETTWLEKLGYMFLGLIVAAGILFVVKKFI